MSSVKSVGVDVIIEHPCLLGPEDSTELTQRFGACGCGTPLESRLHGSTRLYPWTGSPRHLLSLRNLSAFSMVRVWVKHRTRWVTSLQRPLHVDGSATAVHRDRSGFASKPQPSSPLNTRLRGSVEHPKPLERSLERIGVLQSFKKKVSFKELAQSKDKTR